MFELLFVLAFIVLAVVAWRQSDRMHRLEREMDAIRHDYLARTRATGELTAEATVSASAADVPPDAIATAAAVTVEPLADVTVDDRERAKREAMAKAAAMLDAEERLKAGGEPAEPVAARTAAQPAKRDIETALGTRWAVWVGGIALALGGVFLIRYTIEAGVFGPGVRLMLAGLMGLVLVGGGEFLRRTGFVVPVEGLKSAYVPAIATAVGAFMLFGTVYAAHGVYGFIGPGVAFTLLGLIALGTIGASLLHGQALAGIGLLGGYVTPVLVSSTAPNLWALFGYIAVILVGSAAIARLRDWRFLMSATLVGAGFWSLIYLGSAGLGAPPPFDFTVALFSLAVIVAVLALLWLRGRNGETPVPFDPPSLVAAFVLGLAAIGLFNSTDLTAAGSAWYGGLVVAAMIAVAAWRPRALPLLHGAGAAVVFGWLRTAVSGTFNVNFLGEQLVLDGPFLLPRAEDMVLIGAVLGVIFLAVGLWRAKTLSGGSWAVTWSAWAAAAPLVILGSLWLAFGNLHIDLGYAAIAVALTLALAAGGEWLARGEDPAEAGLIAPSVAFVGAGLGLLFAIHMAFDGGWTTVLVGVAAILPALATRGRSYPILGWLSAGAAVAVLVRVGIDPTIVGAPFLSTTPVFNWLLPGYGIPALAFGFAAWQLKQTTDGRPRLVMEAASATFALLTIAMLVRHAMNGGVIDASEQTLAEQSIYTLVALGFGAILIAIDQRSPSPVMRYGSIAAGVVSMAMIVLAHFLVLNPVFTDESTGKIAFFNLILLAYLLPAIAAGALAWYARFKRPQWYSASLALIAALLAFTYATLSVRRIFQGEFIALWRGMSQAETYSYSALWLALGVALLATGIWFKSYTLRVASAALIVVAVAKVFVFDMSELEGVLRALSFIGLGAVLIGIGLFYQRMLVRAAKSEEAAVPN